MSKKTKLITGIKDNKLECKIEFDTYDNKILGKKATLELIANVIVKDSSPVHGKKALYKKNIIINGSYQTEYIDLNKLKIYSYTGKQISINLDLVLKIDDSIFSDTKISQKIQRELYMKPKVSNSAKNLTDPKDFFNFLDNIKVIPLINKIFALGLTFIGVVIISVNSFFGIHDQFVPESQTYLYSHTDSDGEGSSPFFNSLATSGGAGAFIWFLLKMQLRTYMTFFFKRKTFLKELEGKYNLTEIIGGKSRIDLNNTKLKIIAVNMEHGQYIRGSGTDRRTVSFSEPVRGSVLYDETISYIPKNTDISSYFKGSFSFEKMYKALYPPQMITKTHGLGVHWEIQLIHDKYIDQELIGPTNSFKYEYFLEA